MTTSNQSEIGRNDTPKPPSKAEVDTLVCRLQDSTSVYSENMELFDLTADLLARQQARIEALEEAAHTAVLKIQDGSASHAEGVLSGVLSEHDP